MFAGHGCLVIDADQIARSILEPSGAGWNSLRTELDPGFFKDDLSLDRRKLRTAIFSDESLKDRVDALLHPLIRAEIERLCKEAGSGDHSLIVVEVPLLFEAGWQNDFDLVVMVYADEETCLERIMARDGVDREEAEKAVASQIKTAEKAALADHVINNDGQWVATVRQVEALIEKLAVG